MGYYVVFGDYVYPAEGVEKMGEPLPLDQLAHLYHVGAYRPVTSTEVRDRLRQIADPTQVFALFGIIQ
jgi:hypothetical protein